MVTFLRPAWIMATALIWALIFFNSAYAVVPDTINYQGYLTNTADEPINATESITFKIYSIDSGVGPALWEQTKSVEIKDGKFSIELGDDIPPFPPGLFDGPLWLGITVGADAEMTPRKPLTSAPFAISAGDATTLQGKTLNNIIYEDTDARAAMGVKLPTNPLNHDRYTNVEAVAAMGAKGDANTLNHDRFTDPEAVIAMGVKNDTNALNHDRYSNEEAVGAMGTKANTNTLNHDRYTDADAIAAASDEVRTPISSVPFEIWSSGSYYFTDNLIHTRTTTNAITVFVNDVTIDLMGFTLKGPGKASGSGNNGIYMNLRNNITIINGTVREFGGRGIYEKSDQGFGHRIIDVRAIQNGSSGISLSSRSNQVRGCIAIDNGSYGIFAFVSSSFTNNTAYLNQTRGIFSSSSCTLTNNTAHDNGTDGIYGGGNSTLANNTAYENGNWGIYGGKGSTLANNTAYGNVKDGIYGSEGATIIGNSVSDNEHWGINGGGLNLIKDNAVIDNNKSNTANEGGIRVRTKSRVFGNMVARNLQNGIYVEGGDSIIDKNHVADSVNGVNFSTTTGNLFRDNTAAGITGIPFAGSAVDGGGNRSF